MDFKCVIESWLDDDDDGDGTEWKKRNETDPKVEFDGA